VTHHEAARAVVLDRANGFSSESCLDIIARDERLGFASDLLSDSEHPKRLKAIVLSDFAGAAAQQRVDPPTGTDG